MNQILLHKSGHRYGSVSLQAHMIDKTQFNQPLLDWFAANQADLPWRQNRTPYRVWLSEIMLQQTQVATVIPYYERFLGTYPTVADLAGADINDVLKLWEGLGYYSRARNLHKAAQMVVSEFDGAFPDSVAGLKQLPGIGDYTAGAVGSIAFGLDVPVVDGNVIRVLTRLFDIDDEVTKGVTKRELWSLATELIPAGQAANWNEALMDFGRTVCTSTSPQCNSCPMQTVCQAYAAGTQVERPVKRRATKKPHYDYAAAVVQNDAGEYLLAQRPFAGLLGGLWEFPGGRANSEEKLQETAVRVLKEKLSITVNTERQLTTVKHAFTHYKMTRHVFACIILSGEVEALEYEAVAWVDIEDIAAYACPVTDQKITKMLRQGGGQLSLGLRA